MRHQCRQLQSNQGENRNGKFLLQIQNRTNDSNYRYKKKSPETFDILQRIGDESLAIKHAQRLRESFSGTDYAAHKPCTTVYELVEELTHPEKLL